MKKPRVDHGKIFEAYINSQMSEIMRERPCYWARILDSASAGNLIEAREGDFEFTMRAEGQGKCYGIIVECKASTEHNSLASCFRSMLRTKQIARMRLRMRGGYTGVYLFHAVENDEIEVWSAAPLLEAFYQKRTKFFCQPYIVIQKDKFKFLAESWVKNPEEFIQKLIRSETVPVGVSHE